MAEQEEKKETAAEGEVPAPAAEETAPPEQEGTPMPDLTAQLEAAKAELQDVTRKWYAVTAEYENYRKRTAATRSQAYAEGRADVVKKLFPIADNLDRALESCSDEATKQGIAMVLKSFEKLLSEEKIQPICPLGEAFDAEKCEAILAVDPEEGEESGIVKQVYVKGYEQNGKILRFAQVVVTR